MSRPGLLWCVVAALIVRAPTARAGAFEVRDVGWEGCSQLLELARAELGDSRAIPLSHLDWSSLKPDDSILLLHPDHALAGDKLAAFLGAGGRVAVLDDFGAGDRILARFQIERVPPPSRPLTMLRRNQQLPIAVPVREAAGRGSGVHSTVEGVDQLVTNHPTGVRNAKLTPVLTMRAAAGEPDVLLALAGNFGTPPRGKLFAMGDPSALTNQMLRYPGNATFAGGLIRYLGQDEKGGERGRMFVIANQFGESGTYAGVGGFGSELGDKVDAIEQQLRVVRSDGLAGLAGLCLAALAALAVGLWTASVSSRPYRRVLPSFARPVPLLAQGGLAGRAALLSASTTPGALAVLELKNALEEGLSHQLGMVGHVPSARLIAEVGEQKKLDEGRMRELKGVLLQMSKIETLVAAGHVTRTTKAEVRRIARVVFDVLHAAEGRALAPPRS